EAVASDAQFVQADLIDGNALRETLRDNRIEAVIHMAAGSLGGGSGAGPGKNFPNNMVPRLVFLGAERQCGVRRIVFSSTAATYGQPEKQPVEETDPTKPTNPYGETKLAFEHAMRWYEEAYGLHYASLRYFNAAGATEKCGEHHNPETHLIPIV